jgi:hypothetical protein
MVDLDAALFHHFLELPIADRIGHIPADAPKDYLTLKMAAFELNHRAVPLDPFPAIIPQASAMQSLRQNRSWDAGSKWVSRAIANLRYFS